MEAEAFISPIALHARLQQTDFILLGEVHSNPDHHRLQQRIIELLVADGRGRLAVVFEMFERADQSEIERARALPDAGERIARATNMGDRGWSWELYKPLIETALAYDLPLFGADLSRSDARGIVDKGLNALGAHRIEALALHEPLAPRDIKALRAEIVAAHCGHAPTELIEGMIAAQRTRDAMLADGLIANADSDGAVLIAGSGHVRADLAVPAYLRRRAPSKSSVSIAFTEVAGGEQKPGRYVPVTLGRPVFDYLWFTPRSQPENPCGEFEERLRPMENRERRE